MRSTVRVRFWLEVGLASLCGFLAVLTLFWRDWIESPTGLDPDRHSGSLEWAIVVGLCVVCVFVSLVARSEWQRPRAVLAGHG